MSETKQYLAIGEEATRGTKEATTVAFLPLSGTPKLAPEFKDEERQQVRGEQALLGPQAYRRYSQMWKGSVPLEMYSEAGTTKGGYATLLKHLTGKCTSAQNAATGQYIHQGYPHADPFGTGSVAGKGISWNWNWAQGATMKNNPFIGGRIKSANFVQEVGAPLKVDIETFGQKLDTITAEIGSPVFPAENLRMQYNNLKLYTGTITRTGSAPNFTQFAFGSATQIVADKLSIKLEAPYEDIIRLSSKDYPDKTRMNGAFKASIEMTLDFDAQTFSTIAEFTSWLAGASTTNFCAVWDTGVQAGTGDNHMLILDFPLVQRLGGMPDLDIHKDPMITLKYDALFDAATCQYAFGYMLKNTATTA